MTLFILSEGNDFVKNIKRKKLASFSEQSTYTWNNSPFLKNRPSAGLKHTSVSENNAYVKMNGASAAQNSRPASKNNTFAAQNGQYVSKNN